MTLPASTRRIRLRHAAVKVDAVSGLAWQGVERFFLAGRPRFCCGGPCRLACPYKGSGPAMTDLIGAETAAFVAGENSKWAKVIAEGDIHLQ
ncbi:hypothetical protein ACL598_08800 [Bordetella bronchialis]|uniref:hypothetical protein n=1 Tax=Bordetella bronchialis TaxID=463025 RepID=UPI0012EAE79D|nr:hypothetical protein [Bordetella bronchialis]